MAAATFLLQSIASVSSQSSAITAPDLYSGSPKYIFDQAHLFYLPWFILHEVIPYFANYEHFHVVMSVLFSSIMT
jgi:hypothetical protein